MLPKRVHKTMVELDREREYRLHRERLAGVKPCVDNSVPESASYTRLVASQPKKEDRARQIDRDNQHLVANMTHIMSTKGGVDNSEPWRDHNKAVDLQRRRDRRQQQIDRENAQLVQRLEAAKPTVNAAKLERDRAVNEMHASRISRYPYQPLDRTVPFDAEVM